MFIMVEIRLISITAHTVGNWLLHIDAFTVLLLLAVDDEETTNTSQHSQLTNIMKEEANVKKSIMSFLESGCVWESLARN